MHPDFRLEVVHLKSTLDHVEVVINDTMQALNQSQTRVEKLKKSSSGYDDELQVALNVHRGLFDYYTQLGQVKDQTSDLHIKLKYVAMTRALHHLSVVTVDPKET